MCKGEASPGSCFEFFEGLKRLNRDLKNIPEHCSEVAGGRQKSENGFMKV